jgi:hypothetical protein
MHHKYLTNALLTTLALCAIAAAVVAISVQADGLAASPFRITYHQPPNQAIGMPLDERVDASTVTSATFAVYGNLGGLVSGTFDYDAGGLMLTLDPDRPFHAGEVLRVSATGGIFSTGGTALTPHDWWFTAGQVHARSFAGFRDVGVGLPGMTVSDAAWGDYDRDGDLDILLCGYSGGKVCRVYRNDGGTPAPVFTDTGAGLTGVSSGAVAWGDYDQDGDLDIVLAGLDSSDSRVSKVYRNDGASGFTDIGAALAGVSHGAVVWGDADGDGDLDILLIGATSWDPSFNAVSKVYRNDGMDSFSDAGAGLAGLFAGGAAWGDYDNDGDLDILITGREATGVWRASKLYRNDGASGFTEIAAGLLGLAGSVDWGDFDNDGDLDILLAGGTQSSPYVASRVYRNDGDGTFTDINAPLTPLGGGSAAWGDYDNDGDLDILLAGGRGPDGDLPGTRLYRNDGGGAFTEVAVGLPDLIGRVGAWGDSDNDGDLDILLAGSPGSVFTVYRNQEAPALGSVTPSSGSGPVGVTTYFTTTWSDPDGWEDLKQCYFHIGDSPSLAGNVTLQYNAAKNKLWLLEDDGQTWLGGCTPGFAQFFANSQVGLDCLNSKVQGGGDRLGVLWALEFYPGFEGTKKLGLKVKDRGQGRAKARWLGTWTITP